jgi:hypothetical protein
MNYVRTMARINVASNATAAWKSVACNAASARIKMTRNTTTTR